MKNIITILLLSIAIFVAQAQEPNTMVVYKADASELKVAIEDIDSIAYEYVVPGIYDASGNLYGKVVIGSQTWLDKHLITTKFNNGDDITNITDGIEWENSASTVPVMGFFEGNPAPYGGYYNSLVVLDERGVCPAGYHIPTKDEFQALIDHVGGTTGGTQLKSTSNWSNPGTNLSGFNAPGSSLRQIDGTFLYQSLVAFVWTSTLYDGGLKSMVTVLLDNDGNAGFQNDGFVNKGLSIRCIKD